MQPFTKQIYKSLVEGKKLDRRRAESIAAGYGMDDKNTIKELCELAVVYRARELAAQSKPVRDIFDDIVQLYNSQINLSHRTSQSVMLQQYSTPAPIAFLAGWFVRKDEKALYFEPSAGNGLLTVALLRQQVIVNEIDDERSKNLAEQGFAQQFRQDATQPFRIWERKFDGIITNPPFGRAYEDAITVDGFKINVLDHIMAIRALDTMKDSGRAAIIIGGHTEWDSEGRIQAGKNRVFFAYLYKHYSVVDVINVDGKLYSRQGTSFNIRLILIAGRKDKPAGYPPLKDDDSKTVHKFEELFYRVKLRIERIDTDREQRVKLAKTKAKALKLKMMNMKGLNGSDDLNVINERFNTELQKQIDGTLPKNHIYFLGMPSEPLFLAGLQPLPVELSAKRLGDKSSTDYKSVHPFDLSEVKNLPQAIANPIAVFESETDPDRTVILTELKSKNKNFLVIVGISQGGGRHYNTVNSIISLYPKEEIRVAKWIDSINQKEIGRNLILWIDKEKASKWLANHSSNVNAVGLSPKRIAKVIQNFVNPK